MFPSLHVAWSLACFDVYGRKATRTGEILLCLWGAAMMLSTLLTHFHHVADVVGGFLLALCGSRIVYPRLLKRFQSAAAHITPPQQSVSRAAVRARSAQG
jgi:membrane-associated phospholipid phosphatase